MGSFTLYPNAHAEVSSVDGYITEDTANQTWATKRGATSGSAAVDNGTNSIGPQVTCGTTNNRYSSLRRCMLLYDATGQLPTGGVIDSIEFGVYVTAKTDGWASQSLRLCAVNPASNTALATGDFNIATKWNTAALASDKTLASISTSAYATFALNATAITAFANGVNKYGLLMVCDADNSAPSYSSGRTASVTINFADNGTNKPYLTVNYHIANTKALSVISTEVATLAKTTKKALSKATANVASKAFKTMAAHSVTSTVTATKALLVKVARAVASANVASFSWARLGTVYHADPLSVVATVTGTLGRASKAARSVVATVTATRSRLVKRSLSVISTEVASRALSTKRALATLSSLTATAAKTAKLVRAATSTAAGTLATKAVKLYTQACSTISTITASLVRKPMPARAVVATASATRSTKTKAAHAVIATVTRSRSTKASVRRAVIATASGSLARFTHRLYSNVATASASLAKRSLLAFSVAATATADCTPAKVIGRYFRQALTVTATVTGSLARKMGKALFCIIPVSAGLQAILRPVPMTGLTVDYILAADTLLCEQGNAGGTLEITVAVNSLGRKYFKAVGTNAEGLAAVASVLVTP